MENQNYSSLELQQVEKEKAHSSPAVTWWSSCQDISQIGIITCISTAFSLLARVNPYAYGGYFILLVIAIGIVAIAWWKSTDVASQKFLLTVLLGLAGSVVIGHWDSLVGLINVIWFFHKWLILISALAIILVFAGVAMILPPILNQRRRI